MLSSTLSMRYRQLRGTDLRPSVLGLGCARIASISTKYPRREVLATLGTALDEGVTFFDTADLYGQGDSERMLGRVVAGRRSEVVLCTKAGLTLGAPQSLIRWIKPLAQPLMRRWVAARQRSIKARQEQEHQCFEPVYIEKRIEGSLRRLHTDYLDLFLLHNPPGDLEFGPAIIEVLERKRRAGQIRYFGVSCRTEADARVWLNEPGISCLQLAGNLFNVRDIEGVLAKAKAREVGVVCREPFSGGAIFRDSRLRDACMRDPNHLGPVHLALGYLMQRDDIDVVLAGATCRRHLLEILAAIDAPPLTPGTLQYLGL